MIGPQGFHHLQIGRAANASHFCSEVLRKLYSIGTDASRSAVDQDLLSALDISFPKHTQCCGCSNWKGGCFLICYVCWFDRHHPLFRKRFIFSVGAKFLCEGGCEYRITWLELFYIFADSFHFTGEFHPIDWIFGPRET